VAALSVVLAVLLAGSVLLFRHDQEISTTAQRQGALAAARAVALELSTIGAGNAAQHMSILASQSTGEFHDQLSGYSAIFQKLLRAGNVSSRSEVTAEGVERLDTDSATVLLTVAATVTNTQLPTGQPRNFRLAVQLQRSGGRWLASKMDYVG
jgi:Mce-associated membrane protein